MDAYTSAEVVVPHASTNFAGGKAVALYVGVAGDVTAIVGGVATLFKAVPVGFHRLSCTRVNAIGTTATDMVALYGA